MEDPEMSISGSEELLNMVSGPFSTSQISPPSESAELAALICGLIALYAVIRIILEQDVMRKLPFLNVFSFAIAGIMAFLFLTRLELLPLQPTSSAQHLNQML